MPAERIWLDVPYAEKDLAKAEGARWDPRVRRWYAPRPGIAGLERWSARPDIPDLLPGEDRSLGSGLFVDLVPSTCWFTNVRSCVSQRDWERLRRMVVDRAGQVCEICGAAADREARRWLEVHERWTFDERCGTQTLRRLICVCTPCHTVTHFGLAQVKGIAAEAMAHLIAVTGASPEAAQRHVREAFVLWERRSGVVWELDLGMLTAVGITVQPPPDALRRAEQARAELQRQRSSW
ncbi:DUF5710 domain-containing protein [Nocardiopsis sp. EMB25]|uniref:DUF5710 domain-containing protein n=1 Tax=Nocardiopsis sp. EMB25 TaxID=2835867 RepID=UPI002283DCB6|nr:DUF5710 domain-containing protein [Nocardiopsis sp. EMB25]MCY9783131.1 DUF5710 domain-containing protein [Nocardiopsis sp. EMB25]